MMCLSMVGGGAKTQYLSQRRDRLIYGLGAALCLMVLVIARRLTPSTGGVGTHQQLGLPPCTFKAITGHGCPGCGLTTSFTYLARGDIASAWSANPIGLLLFSATALAVPFFLYRLVWPVPIERYIETPWFLYATAALAVSMFGAWLVRLALGLV